MVSIAVFVGVLYFSVAGLLFFFQRSLLYHPSSGDVTPANYGLPADVELVRVETEDGLPLAAWYRPAPENQPLVVYFHGNAGHIGHRSEKIRPYLQAGFGVLLLSYRGYGPNPGFPTEERLYMDGRAALKFLEDRNVPVFRTVIYGESLGTGVAMEMAQDKPFGAVILEAPFTSVPDVAQRNFPFLPARYMVKDKYASKSKSDRLRSPVLVIHGQRDRVIPITFGRALYESLPSPKQMKEFPTAGHNDLYDHGAVRDVIAFITRVIPGISSKTLE